MASPEEKSRTGLSIGSTHLSALESADAQRMYARLLNSATTFRPQAAYASAVKNVCISLLEVFSATTEEAAKQSKVKETPVSTLPSAGALFFACQLFCSYLPGHTFKRRLRLL